MRQAPDEGSRSFTIDALRPEDWTQTRAIFLEGIATGVATFETGAPEWDEWDESHLKSPRLVARGRGEVLGWAALTAVSGRCVYAGVAEVSIYVAASQRGRGVGRALLEALVAASERAGLWTLQAGIFPGNPASLAMHRRCGFREVGRRERLGQLRGTWLDVLLLERRSAIVGAQEAAAAPLPPDPEEGRRRDGTDTILRRFEHPDETRRFEKGRFDIVRLGTLTVGRASYDPGWRWSTHVKPIAGTPLCPVEHVGMVVTGRAKVLMADGREFTLRAGDLFAIEPGHDSWVLGDDPYISLHFLGADDYATVPAD